MATKTITTFHPTGSTDTYNFRASKGPKNVGDANTPIYLDSTGTFQEGNGLGGLEEELNYILYGQTTGTWPDIMALIERGPQFPVKMHIDSEPNGGYQYMYLGIPTVIVDAIFGEGLGLDDVFNIVYLRMCTTKYRIGSYGSRNTHLKSRKWHRIKKGNDNVWPDDPHGDDLVKFRFDNPYNVDFTRDGFSYFKLIMRFSDGGSESWEMDVRWTASLEAEGQNEVYPTGYFDVNGSVSIGKILSHRYSGIALFTMDGEQRSSVAKIRWISSQEPGWTCK